MDGRRAPRQNAGNGPEDCDSKKKNANGKTGDGIWRGGQGQAIGCNGQCANGARSSRLSAANSQRAERSRTVAGGGRLVADGLERKREIEGGRSQRPGGSCCFCARHAKRNVDGP